MEMQYITLGLSILSIVFVIANYVRNSNKDAINDVKDNNRDHNKDRVDIEVFKVQLDNVMDNIKEMKQDMRDIKQSFITYKEDMRDVAKEVVLEIVQLEIQHHVDSCHKKEK